MPHVAPRTTPDRCDALGTGPDGVARAVDEPAGPGAMLGLYARLFGALESAGIDYCVWKNLHELPEALAGRGDIDLHVRPHARAAFADALRAHRFVRVRTHKGHPWVEHHYGFDEPSGALCHLHCYFRLVTGESHVKQYVVPVERYLDALPARPNALGVREMHPWLRRRLHLFRRRIKLTSLPGALLYARERAGYRAEDASLASCDDHARAVAPSDGWAATIAESGPLHEELAAGFAYRRRFAAWSRFAPFATPLHRYGAVAVRAAGKLLGWRKTLPSGVLVALAGERADVERTREALHDWLAPALRLRAFRLPDADPGRTPRGLLRRCRRRRSSLRAAARAAANGSLVVCYGWDPEGLREALVAAAGAPGTSDPVRRALARRAAELDDAPEPDVVLGDDRGAAPGPDRRGATHVATGSTDGWKANLWRALAERQP